ncbi:TPA: hypothetical protein DDW35_10870 [Candidatus Sumerlaeota bacterium]|nr:hypothetical protein [Candidatus Sumerlaeota bacterium]
MPEPLATSPLWLQHSGLPQWLNDEVHKNAWLVFKTVVEIDCLRNAKPDSIEIPPSEIAKFCGLEPKSVMRILEGLRKKKCLALFLPDHPDETALIEIKTPLPTPRLITEVLDEFPFNCQESGTQYRYAIVDTVPEKVISAGKRELQRVVDLYLNTIGFKMNTFILDELRLLCQRFEPEDVEKAFTRAAKNDIRSLGWVAKELYRVNKKRSKPATAPEEP